jgi:DNA-binding FadR family transcriptional regulator
VTLTSSGARGRSNPRIPSKIADDLGVAIVSGRHLPGTILPNEIDASLKLGISRTAYREAVRILSTKGLVESRPKLGTRITERRHWQLLDPDVLRWAFQNKPSEVFIQEVFELRAILEPHAAELAASRRSIEQLARMGHALEEMARHGLGVAEGRAADQRFHEEILLATGNQALITLTATIGAAIHWTTAFKQRHSKSPRDAMPEHRKLYAAIAEGVPERAMQAALELIHLALQDTRSSLKVGVATSKPSKVRKA